MNKEVELAFLLDYFKTLSKTENPQTYQKVKSRINKLLNL